MIRVLTFVACVAGGLALLLWKAGGLRGPSASRPEPVLTEETAPRTVEGGVDLPGLAGSGGLHLRDVEHPRYALPSPRTYHDQASGERVDLPHFVPWTFEARAGRPLAGTTPDASAVQFEDVVVRSYREPATLEEAHRLRADPSSLDVLLHLELFAERARADGIARYLRSTAPQEPGVPKLPDTTIRLEGRVSIHDLSQQIWMRGSAVTFEPDDGRATGTGGFSVEHSAWSLRGEELSLTRDAHLRDLYQVDVRRDVTLLVQEAVLGTDPAQAGLAGDESFRPTRVWADRASLLHDAGSRRHLLVALEGSVRAEQDGGRRLEADRLRLTLEELADRREQKAQPAWSLVGLEAHGNPLTIDVPDLPGRDGSRSARVSARRLRRDGSSQDQTALLLEGDPVLWLEGDLAIPGVPGSGRWIRASATERAVLTPLPDVARTPEGLPVAGRRLRLEGAARLERSEGAAAPFQEVLEGDEITLTLRPKTTTRPGESRGDDPVEFAATGHVRLSGSRVNGEAERLRVERLDTLDPVLTVEGSGTRLALSGFGQEQHLLGADTPNVAPPSEEAPASGPVGPLAAPPAAEEDGGDTQALAWVLDRVEAAGHFVAETHLGGPAAGLPAWVEGDRAEYDRVSGRATLRGLGRAPASIRVDAGEGQQHALRAPTITLERARALLTATGDAYAEVWLAPTEGDPVPAGPASTSATRGSLRSLTLTTDGRIEVRFRLDRPGGSPALGQPQVVRVLAPFTAQVAGERADVFDRVRADRLELVFARRSKEQAAAASAPSARAQRPVPRALGPSAPPPPSASAPPPGKPPAPPRPQEPAVRYALWAERLKIDLEAGRLEAFEAHERVHVQSDALSVEGATLRFQRAVGALLLDGGEGRARARFGEANSVSRLEARTLSVLLNEQGPRWVKATGPTQAVLVQASGPQLGQLERFEVDCQGDVRITTTELRAEAATWMRRTVRDASGPGASLDWSDPSELWSDRIVVRGTNLLAGKAPGAPAPAGRAAPGTGRRVTEIVAEGPSTTFQSGTGDAQIKVWCDRVVLDVPAGRARLEGRPDRDVLVHRAGRYDVEFKLGTFHMATRQLEQLEAGRTVLRGKK